MSTSPFSVRPRRGSTNTKPRFIASTSGFLRGLTPGRGPRFCVSSPSVRGYSIRRTSTNSSKSARRPTLSVRSHRSMPNKSTRLTARPARQRRSIPPRLPTCLIALVSAIMLLSPDWALATGHSMVVSIAFPDGRSYQTTLEESEVAEINGSNVNYMLLSWARAALSRLGLSHETDSGESPSGIAIISIDGVGNDEEGAWVYFANGFRSPYSLDTQLFEGVERLEFRFEPRRR